jgi:hypothetical protein
MVYTAVGGEVERHSLGRNHRGDSRVKYELVALVPRYFCDRRLRQNLMTGERDAANRDVAANLSHVIEIGSAALEQESLRAERFSDKATAQATLAGTWFAVTQVIAAVALTSHTKQGWIVAIVAGIALQTVALCFLLHATARVWKLRPREAIGEETLEGLAQLADQPSDEFAMEVIALYRHILYQVQDANEKRAEAFEADTCPARLWSSSFWWGPVLVVGAAEIATALLSRVL